jgi:hypothetical protein
VVWVELRRVSADGELVDPGATLAVFSEDVWLGIEDEAMLAGTAPDGAAVIVWGVRLSRTDDPRGEMGLECDHFTLDVAALLMKTSRALRSLVVVWDTDCESSVTVGDQKPSPPPAIPQAVFLTSPALPAPPVLPSAWPPAELVTTHDDLRRRVLALGVR